MEIRQITLPTLNKVVGWTFVLFVVAIPLVQPLEFSVFGIGAQLADLIFAFTAVLAVIAVLRRDLSLNWSPSYVYIFLYAGTFILASFFAEDPPRSLGRFAILLYLIAIAVLTSSLSADESRRRKIVLALVIGTALTSLGTIVGIALFYAGMTSPDDNFLLSPTGTLPAGNYPRIHSLFLNANMMCNYMNIGIVAIFLARKRGWISRNLFVGLAAGSWLAAFATLSPGIGGIILSAGLWFWYSNKSSHPRFGSAVLYTSIAAAVFFLAVTLISFDSPNTDQDFRIPIVNAVVEPSARVLVWQQALAKIYRAPVLGSGPGANAADVFYVTPSGTRHLLRDGHDVWVNVTVQTGLVGAISLLMMTGYILFNYRTGSNQTGERNMYVTALKCALIGSFFYQGLTGSFEDARHLWLLFGLIIAPASQGIAEVRSQVSH